MVGKYNWFIIIVMMASTLFVHSYLDPVSAEATTYYVAPTGNDSNPCSQPQPCQTIGHGIAVAAGPGNTLFVATGTYTENPNIKSGGSASGGNFVVQGYAPGASCPENPSNDPFTPKGTNPAPTAQIVGNVQINASYVTFTCFEVMPNINAGINYNYSDFLPTHAGIGISTSGLTTITISENYIHKNGSFTTFGPSNGTAVFNFAIAAGCAGCGTYNGLTNISVIHNFDRMGGGQQTSMSCSGTCVFQDNEEYGGEADDDTFSDGHDLDYNEAENESGSGGGVVSYIGNYMHGADQNFCGATRHNCHVDCFEDSDWGVENMVFDRNICLNQNEGLYLWDCNNSACNTSLPYGTYSKIFNVLATNNIFAFGPNDRFDVCMDIWHGQLRFDNNACWGAYSEASLNSDVQSFQNNILYQSYFGPGSTGQCQTPYGIDLEGGFSPEQTTFDLVGKNIDWQDTTCSVPASGLYGNDLVNTNPLWISPGSYTNTPGALPNLRLQSSSPAIASGSDLCNWFMDDLPGNTRACGPFDIGPYMFMNSSSLNPPTGVVITVN